MNIKKPVHLDVVQKIECYPAEAKKVFLVVRELIFKVAAELDGVGEIEETLKWGEPSYLTSQTKSGSTIRIDWKDSTPDWVYIYFNCKTTLVDSFKEIYGDIFSYSGNRSISFKLNEQLPTEALSDCIAMALSYHLNKQKRGD